MNRSTQTAGYELTNLDTPRGGTARITPFSTSPKSGGRKQGLKSQLSAVEGWRKVKSVVDAINSNMFVQSQRDEVAQRQLMGEDAAGADDVEHKRRQCMIYKDNFIYHILFKGLTTFIMLYSVYFFPLQLGYGRHSDEGSSIYALELAMDFVLLLETFLFFIETYVVDSVEVDEPRLIAKKYFTGWFIVDLLASTPWQLVDYETGLWFKCLRLFRFVDRFDAFVDGTKALLSALSASFKEKTSRDPKEATKGLGISLAMQLFIFRMIKFSLFIYVAAHILACFWNYSQMEPVRGEDLMRTYIEQLYWVITTFTTVGYGYISPDVSEQNQILYTMGIQMFGIGLFAYIMGTINNIIITVKNRSFSSGSLREKIEDWLFSIYQNNTMDAKDRQRVVLNFDAIKEILLYENMHDYSGMINSQPFLNQIPLPLRKRMLTHLFQDIINLFSVFFEGLEEDFCLELFTAAASRKALVNEDIVKVGHRLEHFYFIRRGSIKVQLPGDICDILLLEKGSYMGDWFIFNDTYSDVADLTYKAAVDCNLIEVPLSHFRKLVKKYPITGETLRERAHIRRKFLRKTRRVIMHRLDQVAVHERSRQPSREASKSASKTEGELEEFSTGGDNLETNWDTQGDEATGMYEGSTLSPFGKKSVSKVTKSNVHKLSPTSSKLKRRQTEITRAGAVGQDMAGIIFDEHYDSDDSAIHNVGNDKEDNEATDLTDSLIRMAKANKKTINATNARLSMMNSSLSNFVTNLRGMMHEVKDSFDASGVKVPKKLNAMFEQLSIGEEEEISGDDLTYQPKVILKEDTDA